MISVSDEDLGTVRAFLGRDNGDGATIADVTKGYCLTVDPDRSVYEDFMTAAGRNDIPSAFIVGKTGEIEWIGHPMQMDGPIEAIVDGTWNRAAYADEMAEMHKVNKVFAEMCQTLAAGNGAEAVATIERMIGEATNPNVKQTLENYRRQLDLNRFQMALQAGGEQAATELERMVDRYAEDADVLHGLVWLVVNGERGAPIDEATVAAAMAGAEKAATLDPENGPILDTLAHFYAMVGRLDDAIATQKKAVKLGGLMAEPMKAYLEELEAKAGK